MGREESFRSVSSSSLTGPSCGDWRMAAVENLLPPPLFPRRQRGWGASASLFRGDPPPPPAVLTRSVCLTGTSISAARKH